MAELNSSLTAMDWLPKLTVGGAMANANGCESMGNGLQKGSLRKSPGSPVNPYATLTEQEAREHQLRENKPPYSYANLITFAINSSESKKMTLSEIYQWICVNFPYYREAGSGWKVGIFWLLNCIISLQVGTNAIYKFIKCTQVYYSE